MGGTIVFCVVKVAVQIVVREAVCTNIYVRNVVVNIVDRQDAVSMKGTRNRRMDGQKVRTTVPYRDIWTFTIMVDTLLLN